MLGCWFIYIISSCWSSSKTKPFHWDSLIPVCSIVPKESIELRFNVEKGPNRKMGRIVILFFLGPSNWQTSHVLQNPPYRVCYSLVGCMWELLESTLRREGNFPVSRRPQLRKLSTEDERITSDWFDGMGIAIGKVADTEERVKNTQNTRLNKALTWRRPAFPRLIFYIPSSASPNVQIECLSA